MRVFLAGASAIRERLGVVIRDVLPDLGATAYDWTSDPAWDEEDPDPRDAAERDLDELKKADAVIWFCTGHPSHGAPFEAGFALGAGIPLVIYHAEQVPQSFIYAHLSEPGTVRIAFRLDNALAMAQAMVQEITGQNPPIHSKRINGSNFWPAETIQNLLLSLEAKIENQALATLDSIKAIDGRLAALGG